MAEKPNHNDFSLPDKRPKVSGNSAGFVVGVLCFVVTLAVARIQDTTTDRILVATMALLYIALIVYVVRVKNGLPGLLLPVAGFAIAAYVSVGMFREPVQANESAAIGTLQTIVRAEAEFKASKRLDSNNDGIGDYGSMDELMGAGLISAALVDITRGYKFDLTAIHGTSEAPQPGFQLKALPVQQGTTGSRGFYADESGVIRYSRDMNELGPMAPTIGE